MSKEILKFSAAWCNPCKQLSAVLKNVELGMPLREVDIDSDDEGLAQKYQIRGVPTLVMIENGAEVKRKVGMVDKSTLEGWLK